MFIYVHMLPNLHDDNCDLNRFFLFQLILCTRGFGLIACLNEKCIRFEGVANGGLYL